MAHLEEVSMTYIEHMAGAFRYSFLSAKASCIFLLHGLFPDTFQYGGSDIINSLYSEFKKRYCVEE